MRKATMRVEIPLRAAPAQPLGPVKPTLSLLTARERQVYDELLQARSNKEICSALGITIHTVRFHIHNILAKFGCANRTELLARLLR